MHRKVRRQENGGVLGGVFNLGHVHRRDNEKYAEDMTPQSQNVTTGIFLISAQLTFGPCPFSHIVFECYKLPERFLFLLPFNL